MLDKSNTSGPSIVDTKLRAAGADASIVPPCERALELACEIERLLVVAEKDGSLATRGEVLSVRFAQAFARNLIDQLSELRRTGAA
ncbi:MAG: hypothetical protein U0169_12770 [Polyangiaceae bacterium]